jgi:hypothetical protein
MPCIIYHITEAQMSRLPEEIYGYIYDINFCWENGEGNVSAIMFFLTIAAKEKVKNIMKKNGF